MKVEVQCPSCNRSFLVDEAHTGAAPCPVCGVVMGTVTEVEPAPAESPPLKQPVKVIRKAARAEKAPETPADSEKEEVVCPRCGLHFVPKAARGAAALAQRRRVVLVVEDMDYFLEIARDALEPKYQVKSARNLAEARQHLGTGEIDLMLLDLTLEGEEDALGLLQELPYKPCPVLIYTAEDESEMYGEGWKQLQSLGADDVVIKGMQVGESIRRKVSRLLGEPDDEGTDGA
jgi:CheY-like chemotaxis protein